MSVQLDYDYYDHPKTIALCLRLGSDADTYPPRLWTWAYKFAKNGVIKGGAPVIERACKWRGKPGKLYAALMSVPPGFASGFIESDGETIHGWNERTGAYIKAHEARLKRRREQYAQQHPAGSNGQQLPPANKSGSVAALLASQWRTNGGFPIAQSKAIEHIEQHIARRADPKAIEKAFYGEIKGKKIWEVLNEVTPEPIQKGLRSII